jgi:hypothetical protein
MVDMARATPPAAKRMGAGRADQKKPGEVRALKRVRKSDRETYHRGM